MGVFTTKFRAGAAAAIPKKNVQLTFCPRYQSVGNINLASAPATIDGVAPNLDDLLFFNDQTDKKENGLYPYPGVGNAFVRFDEFDEDSELECGASIWVKEGNTLNDKRWNLSSDNVVIGVDDIEFIGPVPSGSAPQANTFFVSRLYGKTIGVADDDTQKFKTGPLAFAASSPGDHIQFDPGEDHSADVWTIPHPLTIDAQGISVPTTPINIAAGTLQGWVGKSYYGRLSIDVYPLIDPIASHDCLAYAKAVALTQSVGRFEIRAYGGDWDNDGSGINTSAAGNADLIDFIGIGQPFVHGAAPFVTGVNGSVRGFKLNVDGGNQFSTVLAKNAEGGLGIIEDIECTQTINVASLGTESFDGVVRNIKAFKLRCSGTFAQNDPTMTDLDVDELQIGNFGGTAHAIGQNILLDIIGNITKDADIDVSRCSKVNVNGATVADLVECVIMCGGASSFMDQDGKHFVSGRFKNLWIDRGSSSTRHFQCDYVHEDFEMMDGRIGNYADTVNGSPQTVLELGSKFTRMVCEISEQAGAGTGASRLATCQNKATWTNCTFIRDPDDNSQAVRLPMSDGAVHDGCIYQGFIKNSADPLDVGMCGRDPIKLPNGSSTAMKWDFAAQRLDWTFDDIPQTTDGSDHVAVVTGFSFFAFIYEMPSSTGDGDGDLTDVIGFFGEFELVDVAGTWHCRSKASAAVALDLLLGSPGADIDRDVGGISGRLGMAATITINNPTLNGMTIGQELTVLTDDISSAPLNLHSLKQLRKEFEIEHNMSHNFNNDDEASNGNGTTNLNGVRAGVATTGNNGTAYCAWDVADAFGFDMYIQSGVTTKAVVDWDKPLALTMAMNCESIAAGAELLFYFGRESTDGVTAPNDKMIGFEIRDAAGDLFTIAHDGAVVNEVDTGFDFPQDQRIYVTLRWDGAGKFELYTSTDNITFTLRGTVTTNTPSGLSTAEHFSWLLGADNGVSGNVEASIMHLSLFTN